MFGNGASWYIVENGKKVMIDTVRGEVKEIPNYEGTPSDDMHTYSILHRFLMQADMQEGYTSEHVWHEYTHVKKALIQACKSGEVKFTNGAHWYVNHKNHPSVIMVYSIGVAGKIVKKQLSNGSSWQYMQQTPGFVQIDENTIDFLSRNL